MKESDALRAHPVRGELDARRLRIVGDFVLPLLAREYAKGEGRHERKRMGMWGDLWKEKRTTSL